MHLMAKVKQMKVRFFCFVVVYCIWMEFSN